MRSRFMTRVGIALLLLAAVLAVSACGSGSATNGGATTMRSKLPSGTTDATSSVSPTVSRDGSQDETTPGDASVPAPKPLSDTDAKAIDAELSAIQRELNSMSLPNDGDFGGIESGLE